MRICNAERILRGCVSEGVGVSIDIRMECGGRFASEEFTTDRVGLNSTSLFEKL